MHGVLIFMGLNRAAMTVLHYDPAGAYSTKVPWRGDKRCQVSNVIMTNKSVHIKAIKLSVRPCPTISVSDLTYCLTNFQNYICPCMK